MAYLTIKTESSGSYLGQMRNQGFSVVTNMSYEAPLIPDDITVVDDTELMEIFGKLTAYGTFLSTQVACSEVDLKHLNAAVDRTEAALYIRISESMPKATAGLIKAHMAVEEELIAVKDETLVKESYVMIIKQMRDNATTLANFTSRELSRRQGQQTINSRQRNLLT